MELHALRKCNTGSTPHAMVTSSSIHCVLVTLSIWYLISNHSHFERCITLTSVIVIEFFVSNKYLYQNMASNDIRVNARERLMEEFKAWKANHPKVRDYVSQTQGGNFKLKIKYFN